MRDNFKRYQLDRIQKNSVKWGGCTENILFLVINVFHSSDCPREATGPEGPNCFSSGLRTSISRETYAATCDFPGWSGSRPLPPSLDPLMTSIVIRGWYRQTCLIPPVISSNRPFQGDASFVDPFLFFEFRVIYCLVCSLQPSCHLLGKDDLLVLLYVIFSCVFVTFPRDVLGQVWYLVVSISDFCLLPYFVAHSIRVIPSLLCSNCECSLYFGRICFHAHLRFSILSETY